MSSKQQKQQCDPKTTDCIEKKETVKKILEKPFKTQVVGSAGMQPEPMTRPSWRGGRKKRRRKSRKKKRKSRRKTRKKRRRKSRKKRKTRRRKGRGKTPKTPKTSAFKKTMKRSTTVGNLAALLAQSNKLAKSSKPQHQHQHVRRITRQGFKQPALFRPVPKEEQPSQGLEAAQQPLAPLAQQPLAQQMGAMSINPRSRTSSEEELSTFMNEDK